MRETTIVVDGFSATTADDTNMKRDVWSFALDQRAFGPRKLVVAFTDGAGNLMSLAHAPRTDFPEAALACCVDWAPEHPRAAVAFCDQRVDSGPPPSDLAQRFAAASAICRVRGIHLVDWIACDDLQFRSTRLALDPKSEWWSVP
jgi:hypothetical protein